ncbi:MAG: MvaI/BcnI family restriction endonuclease [Methylophilus sp.]|nr:MvaI/BcnI family restriction endonuclease [Methylophilus sp.]
MINSISDLLARFSQLGAINVFCKPLAENDNSKQQIYLGGSFDVVQIFPFHGIDAIENGKNSTYKAKLEFFWIDEFIKEQASGAQLILYPQYPEVRLSGFLKGCKTAPSELMKPVTASNRKFNNGLDGRVLFFAVTKNRETLAYLAPAQSLLANEFTNKIGDYEKQGVLYNLPLHDKDSRVILLEKLAEIRNFGWQPSVKLSKTGELKPYNARNGGGYTLEALLGIVPNGRSEPDFMGWEIKGYSSDRVTLMTPEPTGGIYGESGVEVFVRRFGKPSGNDTLYFTGIHKVNNTNNSTGLTMVISGFNPAKGMIEDVNGAVELRTNSGVCAASWSFEGLLMKWNKKHAQAAYVPYKSNEIEPPAYQYASPTLMGEGTNFNLYLSALSAGLVIFDPASKVMNASTLKSKVKARSQFRMPVKQLANLYQKFGPVEF